MADQGDKPTDGNTKQWEKLQNMRRASGTALTKEDGTPSEGAGTAAEREQRATAEAIKAEQERLQAGEPVGGAEPDEPDDDEGDETETPETVTVREHERKKPEPKVAAKPEETPPPGTEFVEIDGKRVAVDAALAAAYREVESAKVDETKVAERSQMVDEIVERVTSALPKPETPATTTAPSADTAIAAALKAIDDEPWKNPMPDAKTQVSDPDLYNKQLEAHIDEKSDRRARKVLAERDAKDAATRATTQAEQAAREIAWAKEQLAIQFYRQFKVLDDADLKPIVDVALNKKFDEVIASGVLNKPLPPKDREALKLKAFNDVAAAATRQLVKLRGKATSAEVTPAPTPPNLVTSAASTGPKKKPAAPEPKPKEKYPQHSVSAMLAKHKATKEGRTTAA